MKVRQTLSFFLHEKNSLKFLFIYYITHITQSYNIN